MPKKRETTNTDETRLVHRTDAATRLGVTKKTLANWAAEGYGPTAHRIHGRVYYRSDDLTAWIEQHTGGGR